MSHSFDSRAKTWDEDPRRLELSRQILAGVECHVPLASDVDAMDYGCGTGLLSLALARRVRRLTAVDSSKGMLEMLSRKIQNAGLANVVCLHADFTLQPPPPGPYGLVVCAMALHHVPDTEALLGAFFRLTGAGGYLAVADLDTEDGTFHGGGAEVAHHGWDRSVLDSQLAGIGWEGIRFHDAARIDKHGRSYSVFLAVARKPNPIGVSP